MNDILENELDIIKNDEYWESEYSKLTELWCSGKNHKCIIPIENFTKGHVISSLRKNRKSGMCRECKKSDFSLKPFRGEIKVNVVLDKKQFGSDEIIMQSLGIVYFVSDNYKVKIGITDNLFQFVGKRFTNMQSCSPNRLYILGIQQTADYKKLEKELHKKYEPYKSHGEWFFMVEEIREYISQNCFSFTMPNRYFGETHLSNPLILADDLGY